MRNVILLLLTLLIQHTHAQSKKPNIILLFADDQTINTLGCYGNPNIHTPNIDKLAQKGTRFQNALVSQPICWASRTTILTGMTARGYRTPGKTDYARPETVETLYTDLLRQHNYRTGHIGKWHAHTPTGFKASDHFDTYTLVSRNPFYKTQPDGTIRHETELIIDHGIDFIKEQPKDQPFALNLWFNAAHAEDYDNRPGIGQFPWPKAVDHLYRDTNLPDPELKAAENFDNLPPFIKTSVPRERYYWRWNTPEKYQTNIRAYYRMVSGIDQAIGRLLTALEASGQADNTIIIYTADNGYHMGNRGLAGKWTHHEQSLQVPLIIHDPRLPAGSQNKTTSAPALNLDLPTTILDWAGIPIPERYQGRSLTPLLTGTTPADWPTETYHEHFAVRHLIPAFEGIRTTRYKYARYLDHDHEFLHDLEKDPLELINLADSPEHQKILTALRKRTDQKITTLGGPLDPPDKKFRTSTKAYPTPQGTHELLNGKNLRAWSYDPNYWSHQNNILTIQNPGTLANPHSLTWKNSTLANYEITLEIKHTENAKLSLQPHAQMAPKLQKNQLDHTTGTAIPLTTEAPDTWHTHRIKIQGKTRKHWINDKLILDILEENKTTEGILSLQLLPSPAATIEIKKINLTHL